MVRLVTTTALLICVQVTVSRYRISTPVWPETKSMQNVSIDTALRGPCLSHYKAKSILLLVAGYTGSRPSKLLVGVVNLISIRFRCNLLDMKISITTL